MNETRTSPRYDFFRALLWAIFLGCSWTWCIGMFLPVLLIRDFGLAGWIVFAVPNVIGAAAVGFMRYCRSPGVDPVAVNRKAMGWFSVVTIAFHFFFVCWFLPMLSVPGTLSLVLWLGFLMLRRSEMGETVLFVTVMALIGVLSEKNLPSRNSLASHDLGSLALLSPSIVIGFLLCPHLDLTLQSARRETRSQWRRTTFVLGFGGIFLVMIVFSLFYSKAVAGVLAGGRTAALSQNMAIILCVYMAAQSAFTVVMHARELGAGDFRGLRWPAIIAAVAAAGMGWAANRFVETKFGGVSAGEQIYRGFLGFYGLVFPAYAWAAWRCRATGRPPRWVAWLPSVVVGLPLLAVGFLGGKFVAVPVAVALVLVNPLIFGTGKADDGREMKTQA